MTPSPTHSSVDEAQLLTTVGLLLEAHAGLTSTFERRLLAHDAVSGQAFEILLRLSRSPDYQLRMSDLAAQTTLTASGLTRAVDRLEREGLVAREACSSDRRVSYAVLTDLGRERIDCALPIHLEHLRELLDGTLSPAEILELGRLLRRVRDAVNPEAACASLPGGTPEPAR